MTIEPVAFFHSPVKGKFGVPRQAGLAPSLEGEVRFVHPYDDPVAVRGLEGFEYCWLIWGFSLNPEASESLTVRPPRLGGNERVGVFASRSPFRPNGLGLSCVRIESIGDGVLKVSGADLADDTPIYDVKPYVAYSDSRPGAKSGFVDAVEWEPLEVVFEPQASEMLGAEQCKAVSELLSLDPRPQYQDNPDRIYGMLFGSMDVKFRVDGKKVVVVSAEKC
ncbi:MAG: tRNA (N6-threonylcarbamoyladenosine(37)-N6)-methyltransferase TrmO [Bacteroidales bacterium]|nr:tRNA (N6-threonylcarbamoyladenosine(37)-N6)-methyltransferase TrmO [Bacteroidales bacterium]